MCWDFLFPVWSVIALPEKILRWISECISTTRFPINMNGESNGFKPGGRGLRQGDPMSPYLFFVLAMEVFSGLMTGMVEEGKFKFYWKCDKERITHLCFADDLMIFYRGESDSVSRVAGCLQQFKDLSGLSPNPDKSHLFTSGVPAVVKEELLNIL